MISFRKLTIKPHSPDRVLEQSSIAESALARIAHVNWLGREVFDVLYYNLDFSEGTTATLLINSKKGIINIDSADSSAKNLLVALKNKEIEATSDKFYIQVSVYCNNVSITPIAVVREYLADTITIEIKNLDDADDWTTTYLYYEIIKID